MFDMVEVEVLPDHVNHARAVFACRRVDLSVELCDSMAALVGLSTDRLEDDVPVRADWTVDLHQTGIPPDPLSSTKGGVEGGHSTLRTPHL
jgi:hypothetical protein